MDGLIGLLRESHLIQGTLAVLCAGAIVYCVVNNLPVPEVLSNAFLLILGFYFGSKAMTSGVAAAVRMTRKEG